ncbi:hypothetical protein BASA83_001053 [Batrachochytrium salamandrivorans]|nr:hypothetical protein BASA83_001053 [Batrachochytrium salamandrivorans]
MGWWAMLYANISAALEAGNTASVLFMIKTNRHVLLTWPGLSVVEKEFKVRNDMVADMSYHGLLLASASLVMMVGVYAQPPLPSQQSPGASQNSPENAGAANCFSLRASTACPEFGDFSLVPDNHTPPLFTNLATFDSYITGWGPSPNFQNYFKSRYNCPNWDGSGLRYGRSLICGLSVSSAISRGCAAPASASTKQLCKATANTAVASYQTIFSNTRFCPASSEHTLDAVIVSFVEELPPAAAPGCIEGVRSDLSMCGFNGPVELLAYCVSNVSLADACCTVAQTAGNIPLGAIPPRIRPSATSTTLSVSRTSSTLAASTTSVPPVSNTTKGESSSLNNIPAGWPTSPIYIGAGITCIGAIIAIVCAFVFARVPYRNQEIGIVPDRLSMAVGEEVMEVLYDHTPQMLDEIELRYGDQVVIKNKFDDGWAFGYNLVTKQEGSFPMACMDLPDSYDDGVSDGNQKGVQRKSTWLDLASATWQVEPKLCFLFFFICDCMRGRDDVAEGMREYANHYNLHVGGSNHSRLSYFTIPAKLPTNSNPPNSLPFFVLLSYLRLCEMPFSLVSCVAAAIALLTSSASAQSNCFSLKGSTSCPEFAAYSVLKDTSQPSHFSDLTSFDSYIRSAAPISPGFQSFVKTFLNCPGWDGTGVRYSESFNCGLVIANSGVCNMGIKPVQICKATASFYLGSLSAMFRNTAFCPAGLARGIPAAFSSYANGLTLNDPTTAKNCIIGTAAEVGMCGFGSTREVAAYCTPTTNSDPCCAAAKVLRNDSPSPATTPGNNNTTSGTSRQPSSITSAPTFPQSDSGSSGSASTSVTPNASINANNKAGPSSDSSSSSSSNSSSASVRVLGLNPILFGGIIAAIGVVVASVMFVVARRRSPSKRDTNGGAAAANGGTVQVAKTMEVIYEYFPNLHDEIELHVGDRVIIKTVFDDGWALGFNMVTKQEGSFPMECLAQIGSGHSAPHDSVPGQHRVSSMRMMGKGGRYN